MDKFTKYLQYLQETSPQGLFEILRGKREAPVEGFSQQNVQRNADALTGILDKIQFYGLEDWAKTPESREAIKDFEYSNIAVPFGYETQEAFPYKKDLVAGARFGEFPFSRTVVPGQVDNQTLTHEALHKYYLDRGMYPSEFYEEKAVRNQDYINAAKNKSQYEMSKAAHYLAKRFSDKDKNRSDPRRYYGLMEILSK